MAASYLCRLLPGLHSNLKKGVLFIQNANYARGNRGFYAPDDSIGNDYTQGFDSSKDLKLIDEDLIDQIEDMSVSDKVIQDDTHLREKIIKKTIERKYFKPPQEPNFLTWDAKEQIRYLNQEYPDEWTPDILAECFPVTKQGVINILQSHYFPRTLKEVLKHDRRVQKNWLALKRSKKHTEIEAGPLVSHYQKLLSEGKDWTFLNATGIKELPTPQRRYLIGSGGEKREKVGTFESIVKNYVDQKNAKEQREKIAEEKGINLFRQHEQNNLKMLESFTKSALVLKKEDVEKDTKKLMEPKAKINYKKYFQTQSLNEDNESDVTAKKTREKSLLDVEFSTNNSENRVRHIDLDNEDIRRESSGQHKMKEFKFGKLDDQQYKIDKMGMNSTPNAMTGLENKQNSDASRHTRYLQYSNVIGNNELKEDDMVYERQDDSGKIDAYMYDSESGYQHPYGKKDSTPQNIPVPSSQNGEGKVFKKAKNYYDEDGEFLYRVP